MYCRLGLNRFLLITKRNISSRDLKKIINEAVCYYQTGCPLSTLSNSVKVITTPVISNKANYWMLQGRITLTCLSQSQNFHTTENYFPRKCKNTEDGGEAIDNMSDHNQPVPHEVLASKLLKCSSMQEQVEELCQTLFLTTEDIKRRNELCLHVKEMLSPFFKNFRVQSCGSSANGFGVKGCDLDMSISIIGDNRKLVYSSFIAPDIPSVHDVLEGKVTLEYLAKLPQKEQLMFVHSVFLEYYKETSEPVRFCNSYIPIVRFHHDKYALKCDLSFNNSVAFRNTKMLKLCKLLDERVAPLMMTIRYWAKHTGLNAGKETFNTYTISLLVLYFLQTCKPAVLPSTEYLLSISEYLHNDDMEDQSYLQALKKIPASENRQTIVELLKEFFFFYAYFNYNLVMCPLTASAVPRIKIIAQKRNFKMNSIAIQDPIRLNHNVACLVHTDCCRDFRNESLMAVKLFYEGKLLSPLSSNWGILTLFEKPENNSASLSENDHLLSFQIPCISVSHESMMNTSCSNTDVKQTLFQKMSHVILNVLEYGLLFKCRVEEDFGRAKDFHGRQHLMAAEKNQPIFVDDHHQNVIKTSDRSGHLKDVLCDKKPSFVIHCTAYQNTLSGREDMKRKICVSNSFYESLELEHSISVELANQGKTDEKKGFSFICECYELNDEKQTSVLVKFKPCQQTGNPCQQTLFLGLFLRDYIPKTVTRILNSTKAELPRQQNILNSV